MERLVFVEPLDGFRLRLLFADRTEGVVSLEQRLFGPVFEPLLDPDFFSRVQIDEFGAPFWSNGADLAPDALYAEVRAALIES